EAHECLIATVECATDPWDGVMEANTHRHVAQRNVNLVTGSANLSPLLGRLGGMFSNREKQMVITNSSVNRTNFVGPEERGLAEIREAPDNWNHSGITFGKEDAPIAAVRPSASGMLFFDLRNTGRIPAPEIPLRGGIAVSGSLSAQLPLLL